MGFKGRINLCGRCYYDIWYGRFFIFISSIKYDKKVLCLGRNKNILRGGKNRNLFGKRFDINHKTFGPKEIQNGKRAKKENHIQRIFKFFKSMSLREVLIVIITSVVFMSLSSTAVWLGKLISEAFYG